MYLWEEKQLSYAVDMNHRRSKEKSGWEDDEKFPGFWKIMLISNVTDDHDKLEETTQQNP